MSACFSPDEFVDLADGVLSAERRAHLTTCADCRAMAADVAEALRLAAEADVPEPPALFWPSINARVRAALDDAPAGWRAWLRVDVLVPLGGLALVVVALAASIDRLSPAVPAPGGGLAVVDDSAGRTTFPADVAGEPAASDDALTLMVDLAESLPEGGWDALGVARLPDMDIAVSALDADEQAALADLLHQAVERPKS
jgi:hypothetical protein